MSNLGEFLGEAKEFDLGQGKILILGQPMLCDVRDAERWERDNPKSTTIERMAQLIYLCAKKVNPAITLQDIENSVPAGKVLNDIVMFITGEDKADEQSEIAE